MKRFLNRMHKEKGGFTLIELVIVIAILGVLMAIALPNFSGITDRGNTNAAKAELVTVQTAVDVMMAKLFLTSVNITLTPTNDMADFPDDQGIYPEYLRSATTAYNYTCGTSGNVTQVP